MNQLKDDLAQNSNHLLQRCVDLAKEYNIELDINSIETYEDLIDISTKLASAAPVEEKTQVKKEKDDKNQSNEAKNQDIKMNSNNSEDKPNDAAANARSRAANRNHMLVDNSGLPDIEDRQIGSGIGGRTRAARTRLENKDLRMAIENSLAQK